jgi:hypothetical protein
MQLLIEVLQKSNNFAAPIWLATAINAVIAYGTPVGIAGGIGYGLSYLIHGRKKFPKSKYGNIGRMKDLP